MGDAVISPRLGEKVPFVYGMSRDGAYWSFEDQAGRPAMLILLGGREIGTALSLMQPFLESAAAFAAVGADIVILASAGARDAAVAVAPAGARLILCPAVPALGPDAEGPWILTVDRALRLVSAPDLKDPPRAVTEAIAALAVLPRETASIVTCPAPALVVPGVLNRETCRRLIERFESGDHREGAMASVDGGDALVNRIDAAKKHRRDLVLDAAEPLHAEIMDALSTRLIPEITKAFQAHIAYVDRILIARYDQSGGYFKRHRDNASPHVAFREFALSLNLNTGEYEGGGLMFPEFNDCQHQPPAGSACVFSASLLHEASPVTRGTRYVALTFLHSQAAEAKRLAGLQAAA